MSTNTADASPVTSLDMPPEPVALRATLRQAGEDRQVRFRASTPALDRHGTIVKPEGINTEKFDSNPVFLWGHDGYGGFTPPEPESVIGKVTDYERSEEAFDIDVEFTPEGVNPRADMAYQLVKAGFLNAVSIGFIPSKYHFEEGEGRDVLVFDESELLEVSLVPIPSNPEAVALVRAIARHSAIPNGTPDRAPPTTVVDPGELGRAVRAAINRQVGSSIVRAALRGRRR
jgi:HK97 family phage prohead protease